MLSTANLRRTLQAGNERRKSLLSRWNCSPSGSELTRVHPIQVDAFRREDSAHQLRRYRFYFNKGLLQKPEKITKQRKLEKKLSPKVDSKSDLKSVLTLHKPYTPHAYLTTNKIHKQKGIYEKWSARNKCSLLWRW
jgi:hypothetical protein